MLLLACILMLGLSVSASAYTYDYFFKSPQADRGFGSGSSTNSDSALAFYDAQNENSKAFFQLLLNNLSMSKSWKYTIDQSNNASVSVGEYLTYALHGFKGTITSSGNIIASNDLGSDSKDYFLTRWANMNSNATITDANRWRVQTLSDNSQYSWLYQVASGAGSMLLLTDALMNWSNPSFGMYSPADTANYSWFNQVLQSVNNSKADTSKLATESTLATVSSRLYTLNALGAKDETLSALRDKVATESTLNSFFSLFNGKYSSPSFSYNSSSRGWRYTFNGINRSWPADISYQLNNSNYMIQSGVNALLKLKDFFVTDNDVPLHDATDGLKPNVTNYVSDKGSNYGDSFTIGDTISGGLKPELSTSDASSAIGGLFSPESSDYWGWFSSATDSDLHPAASDFSTLSLDDEPSSQDFADSETVWVIDPSVTSSDLIADFFGGE